MGDDITSYLGQKGYTLFKSKLSINEQVKIRDELTVKPFTPSSLCQVNPFPVYRKSNQKMYVPRYYGLNKYGKPNECRLDEPNSIDLEFNGNLRDYQNKIVDVYMKSKNGGGLLEIPCGRGKNSDCTKYYK